MKIPKLLLGLAIGKSVQTTGNFFEEMEKFKDGLKKRPQTYRKIEISEVEFGSCADECPIRKTVVTRAVNMNSTGRTTLE